MTDPYRPPDAAIARSPDAPPMWESFTTWGVAIASILFGLVWWLVLAFGVFEMTESETVPSYFRSWRFWGLGVTFSLAVAAGIALLMARGMAVLLYAGCVLALLAWAVHDRMSLPLFAIGAVALAFTAWAYVLKRRGRFRRVLDGRHARQDRAPE